MLQQSVQGALRTPQGKLTDEVFMKWKAFENQKILKYLHNRKSLCTAIIQITNYKLKQTSFFYFKISQTFPKSRRETQSLKKLMYFFCKPTNSVTIHNFLHHEVKLEIPRSILKQNVLMNLEIPHFIF